MKKNLLLALLFVSIAMCSQQLASIYKGGDIKLIPVTGYAKNNDWNKLFPDYKETDWGYGMNKQIVVTPDGSVFMSHLIRNSVIKFDLNGNFVKRFEKKSGKAFDSKYMSSVDGILDGKYLYTSKIDGRMLFFDLNGKWVKTIKLKYIALETTPLKNGRIAINGSVPGGNKSRNIVSILNLADGKERIISSEFVPYFSDKTIYIHPYIFTDKNGKEQKEGETFILSLPFSSSVFYKARLASTSNGNLVTAYPATGRIEIFDNAGKKIREFKADVKPEVFTKEDRDGYYQKAEGSLKKAEIELAGKTSDKSYMDDFKMQCKQQLEKFSNPANYPTNLPYFSEMIVDSENNILLFRFTRKEGSNKFDVFTYNSQGSKISTSSFVADDYDLKINPSFFKFYKQYIYSVVKLKGLNKNPLRLVKFDLKKK